MMVVSRDRGDAGDALHHQPDQHAALGQGPAGLLILHRGTAIWFNCSKIKKFAGCNGLSYKHNKGFSHFHPIPGKIESHWTCQSCQFPFSLQL